MSSVKANAGLVGVKRSGRNQRAPEKFGEAVFYLLAGLRVVPGRGQSRYWRVVANPAHASIWHIPSIRKMTSISAVETFTVRWKSRLPDILEALAAPSRARTTSGGWVAG